MVISIIICQFSIKANPKKILILLRIYALIEVEIFKEIIAVKTGLKVLCKRFVNDCYGNLSMFY